MFFKGPEVLKLSRHVQLLDKYFVDQQRHIRLRGDRVCVQTVFRKAGLVGLGLLGPVALASNLWWSTQPNWTFWQFPPAETYQWLPKLYGLRAGTGSWTYTLPGFPHLSSSSESVTHNWDNSLIPIHTTAFQTRDHSVVRGCPLAHQDLDIVGRIYWWIQCFLLTTYWQPFQERIVMSTFSMVYIWLDTIKV